MPPRCLYCGAHCEALYCSRGCADADQAGDHEERREAFLRWVDEPDQPTEG